MILKVSLLFVSDNKKLCHLLQYRNLYFLMSLAKPFFRNFNNRFVNYNKYPFEYHPKLKMSTSATGLTPFKGKEDRYEGITVFSEKEPCDLTEFPEKFKCSLEEWSASKKRGIWFKVHLDQCEWVPILVKNGFKYHHAKEDYVMLYFWLPSHEINNIPNYAHTMVGVGAVVVNDSDQILVVKEKHFYKLPMWKLPGGYVEPGENLVNASIREVQEETGIETEFVSVLTLTHRHSGMFGCSDIYVVVNLKALDEKIQKCEREIAECQWMEIEEYLSHPHVHELNRFFVHKLLHHRKNNIKIDCHHGIHQLSKIPFNVYSVIKVDDLEDVLQIPFVSVTGKSNNAS